ncbi:MAG: helix-turn-helix transcriptional regulator [Solobacterium sp.]|nr:helix-turn-helix transcriptional regulator [Solobacterium sp.]
MRIGEKLKEYRISHQIKQEVLAKQLGVTAGTLSNWEAGRRIPDISSLRILSETLGMSYNELLSDEDYRIHTESTRVVQDDAHRKAEIVLFSALNVLALLQVIFKMVLFGTGMAATNQLRAGELLILVASAVGLALCLKEKAVPKAAGCIFFCFVLSELEIFLDPQIRMALIEHYKDLHGIQHFWPFVRDGLTILTACLVLYGFAVPGRKDKRAVWIIVLLCIIGLFVCTESVTLIISDWNEVKLLEGNAFLQWPSKADIFSRIVRMVQTVCIVALVIFEYRILERKRSRDMEMEEKEHVSKENVYIQS